jgi:endoglucanase
VARAGGQPIFKPPKLEEYYKLWIELTKKGASVHGEESGCWNKTPHDVFIAWCKDVLSLLSADNIGFAGSNFVGDFGVPDSGRS